MRNCDYLLPRVNGPVISFRGAGCFAREEETEGLVKTEQ